jgi:hypothetical protein
MDSGDNSLHYGDAFRWRGGLGKSALRVFEFISGHPGVDVDGLHVRLRMSKRQVRHHVARLVAARLVEREGKRLRRGEGELLRVAHQLGTLGLTALQRAQHEAERDHYHRTRREHARVRDEVLRLAADLTWPPASIGSGLAVAGGKESWRNAVRQASLKNLFTIRAVLSQRRAWRRT